MPYSEIEESELLLFLAGALPMRRKALLSLRCRLDARLRGRLRRLREEEEGFSRAILPGLAEKLKERLAGEAWRETGAKPLRRPSWEAARGASMAGWLGLGSRPKAVFAGIALSMLLAGSIWAVQSDAIAGLERERAYLVMAEGHPPIPMLILGY